MSLYNCPNPEITEVDEEPFVMELLYPSSNNDKRIIDLHAGFACQLRLLKEISLRLKRIEHVLKCRM